MAAFWEVWLKNQAGDLVAVFDSPPGIDLGVRVNESGAFGLQLRGDDPRVDLFELDGQVEFYRADAEKGVARTLVFEGHHMNSDDGLDKDGVPFYISTGLGYNALLSRRIIDQPAGTVEAERSGLAEVVAKSYVYIECSALALTREIPGLSVDPIDNVGNYVRMARAKRNVLTVVQECAAIGGGDFAVVGTGPATYEFRWYDGQLGIDRSTTVIFATEWGNMGAPRLRHRCSNDVNAVLVGGHGDGVARTTVWREDPARIADSPINRRESFIDQRQESDATGLDTAGDLALEEGRAPYQLSFEVLQVPSCLYGLHYFLGDLVTVKFKTYTAVQEVVGLDFVVDGNGEKIKVILGDPPAEIGT